VVPKNWITLFLKETNAVHEMPGPPYGGDKAGRGGAGAMGTKIPITDLSFTIFITEADSSP
jgi:hypothetical protein